MGKSTLEMIAEFGQQVEEYAEYTVGEQALGRPVSVEILESAVSGSKVCKFKIAPEREVSLVVQPSIPTIRLHLPSMTIRDANAACIL